MSNLDGSSSTFDARKQRVANELVHYLNSEQDEAGSLILNWNALKDQIGDTAQQEALDEALEYFQDPSASYAHDDEWLRNEIERVLSDIMDNKLPNPIATPGTTPESSTSSSHSGDSDEDDADEASEPEGSRDGDSETQTVQLNGDSETEMFVDEEDDD